MPVTVLQIVLGLLAGFGAGVLSGAFGVGGGIVTTPVIRLMGGTAIEAIATSLPVIIPTAMVGAYTYWKAGEVSRRAVAWGVVPGTLGAIGGALATAIIDPRYLLILIAVLLAAQAIRLMRSPDPVEHERGMTPGWQYAIAGLIAGVVSGLLGVGGGIVFVPIATTMLGMPIKRALGTSLVLISAIAIPGTLAHAAQGNIDWAIFLVLVIGVVPGARIGATLALRTEARRLRTAVATFLFIVALGYGSFEVVNLVRGGS